MQFLEPLSAFDQLYIPHLRNLGKYKLLLVNTVDSPPPSPGNPIRVPASEATSGCVLLEGRAGSVWSLRCFNVESMSLNHRCEGLSCSVAHTVSLSAFQGNTQNFQYASYYWPKVSNSHRLFQLGSVQWDRLFDMLIEILLLHQDRR